ncbi:MAG: hypothetical protein B7Z08_07855 [Sphingomonadales bacterium 32-68-7]|nr:MAG: hypothetical protein B7Z33_01950 [Sphingomonadales bacterium 12-68-11]OYX08876.1 MAG: hypothetical protein B7Z08_07855 [Sphingomonadales bacterium 32-68-7]
MTVSTKRIGALALSATFCAALLGAAQAWAAADTGDSAPAAAEAAPSSTPAETIRFVAEPVVQPLPDQPAEPAEAASLHALVAEMPADQPLSHDMRCLAQAIYFEARGEPLDGQLAVGRVVVNRAASGRFPSDYCGVVTQRGQFSFVRGGRVPGADERSSAWRKAVALAHIAHRDLWDSQVDDALFFHATYVRPRWAHRKVATIDNHVFYR